MAILKDMWVQLKDGRVGKVMILDYTRDNSKFHLVQVFDGSINTLQHHDSLTPIDPAFHNLLTDVYKESHGNKET